MTDVPLDAPSSCPGTQSERAGQESGCQGCPNQSMCSSGQAKLPLKDREPDVINAIKCRLGSVRHRIIILSGKGGVGKSTVSACLARGLSRYDYISKNSKAAYRVGLLDLDLCGPSIPCMFGCIEDKVHQSQYGWSPVFVSENLSLMSVGFLLPKHDSAVIWRGPKKNTLIRQMLTETCWTEDAHSDSANLDFLLIDTPPGTSDEHLSVIQYLQAAECIDGALIVTTPQEVALCDVRKEIDFCRKLSLPILGIVENMYQFVCPSCHYSGPIFPVTSGGAASLSGDELDLICRLPLDPKLTRVLDEGQCPFELAEVNDNVASELLTAHDGGATNTLKSTDDIMVGYRDLICRLIEKLSD